jgi:hypothetical protein
MDEILLGSYLQILSYFVKWPHHESIGIVGGFLSFTEFKYWLEIEYVDIIVNDEIEELNHQRRVFLLPEQSLYP